MNTNAENKNELGNPTSFGVVLGLLAGMFAGPAGAVAGFISGAALGFWYDKRQNNSVKSSETPVDCKQKDCSTSHYNH